MWLLAILYTGQFFLFLTDFSVILYISYGRIWRFGGFKSHLNREHLFNNSLFSRQNRKLVINYEVAI